MDVLKVKNIATKHSVTPSPSNTSQRRDPFPLLHSPMSYQHAWRK